MPIKSKSIIEKTIENNIRELSKQNKNIACFDMYYYDEEKKILSIEVTAHPNLNKKEIFINIFLKDSKIKVTTNINKTEKEYSFNLFDNWVEFITGLIDTESFHTI